MVSIKVSDPSPAGDKPPSSKPSGITKTAISSALAGAILGWAVKAVFGDPKRIDLWIALALSLLVIACSALILSFHTEIDKKVNEITASNKNVEILVQESIGRQASLIPRNLVYKEMATSIRNARSEVAVITYLMVDWQTGKRTFMPAAVDTPYRGEFYDAIFEAIRNPSVSYIRVWEVPHSRIGEAMGVIESDENQKKEVALIREVSKERPDQARLIISDQLTTASFILIDKKNLFLNIDFYDPQKNMWHSPYMLYVKDASGEAFNDLQSVIVRLTAREFIQAAAAP